MTHYRFMVESNALAGQEDEYHDFYDNRHTADILRLPGVQTAQRFNVVGAKGEPKRFMMIVDYETDDLPGLLATIKKNMGGPDMPSNPAVETSSVKITILEARDAAKRP